MSEIELDELAARLGELSVLDVRSPQEFTGEGGYPCDPRHGHIPGALHLDVQELLSLDPDEIRARVGEPRELAVYCHSGSRSDFAAQVLRSLGYDARNYRGSWHEWSRTELPVES